ncbi:MAG: 2Fe-2S iron-sulfur cluster-binding protein [Alphaproteobacteria bacterium]|nr:2Fe-2S iron-sulfur cluster-binding protein [Alphaproteobacteria bacterium]
MNHGFYPLTVQDTREEIGGLAKSVIFRVPDELRRIFAWRAGQHVCLRFVIDGHEQRRSYSISSSLVSGDPLQITVKRVAGGLISNHINDVLERGDVVDVMAPYGTFCLDTAPNLRRTHYFFGAGSGITPLISMIRSVMCNEPHSTAYLAYGNRNADSILFREPLAGLVEGHGERFGLSHVLSAPSMWSGFSYWRKGTVDREAVEALIAENPPYAQDAQYYVCGPGNMNNTVKAGLMLLDVPASRIHMENFGAEVESDTSVSGIAANARIHLDGRTHDVRISQNQTVLEAMRNAGLSPPYSCQSGVCGACRAIVKDGAVHMRARMALEDGEIDNGHVLTCQSVPMTDRLSIQFD